MLEFTKNSQPVNRTRTTVMHSRTKSLDQDSTLETKDWTLEAKAIGLDGKDFKHMGTAKITICSKSDHLTG